ncbi:MAG: 50S ribosomal protein L13 [Patescibacteria group bacterium]
MPKAIIKRQIHTIDAAGVPLGRLATHVAMLLRGKNKTTFRFDVDGGDFVNVLNATKVKFTGKKFTDKKYFWHTFFPGGAKQPTIEQLFKKSPQKVIWKAVWGMLPTNRSRKNIIKRLKISK